MHSFSKKVIENQKITKNLLQQISEIYEYKGTQKLYKKQSPHVLKNMLHIATIQSTESSNRIEGIVADHTRIVEMITKRKKPLTRPEEEIMGYKHVLKLIHNNHKHIPFSPNSILQFHGDLYRYTSSRGGKWKTVDNLIEEAIPGGKRKIRFRPVSAFQTQEMIRGLHQTFNMYWKMNEINKLLLISTYILDFLCIHPFIDGNGRVSRLVTLLLLYQSGFELGKYISLEKIIEDTKESYYDCLYQSSKNWHQGKHNLQPWWEYFLAILLEGYKQFEKRVGFTEKAKGSKTSLIIEAIDQMSGEFSIQDIQEKCPIAGIDLTRRVMRDLRNKRKIECIGRGPNAKWKKKR